MGVPVSVIHAPWEIDGKEAVILSTPLGPDANNGYLYVGLYQADGTFEWKYLQKIKADEYGNSSLGVLSDKSIGVLYKGSEEDIVFTGMNQEWLTAPRSKAFGIPVIEDIEMQQDGKDLAFTVKLDSVLMKKGSQFLKIKVAGEDARAESVSGNASKQYVFRYEIDSNQAVTVEAVNVGAGNDGSFRFRDVMLDNKCGRRYNKKSKKSEREYVWREEPYDESKKTHFAGNPGNSDFLRQFI